MADSMPNEQKQHLPSCLTKEKVYRMYEEDMKTLHKESKRIGYTQFRNMWREHFQHVLIPKVCCNWYYWTKSRLENEVWPNFAAFSITYFKPVFARNERVKFMNVAFVLHISGKLIPEVWYMHNYKRAHPQT